MPKKKRAQLKRPSATRTRASRAAPKRAAPKKALTAGQPMRGAITLPQLTAGEVYAGVLLKEGKPAHHVILLPGEAESVTWIEAEAFAKKAGGELPTRKEQALLFANAADHFQKAYYWSGAQYAGSAEYAWNQNFNNGCQSIWRKGDKDRARAVRRVVI